MFTPRGPAVDSNCQEQLRTLRSSDAYVLGQAFLDRIHEAVTSPEGTANLDARIQEIEGQLIGAHLKDTTSIRATEIAQEQFKTKRADIDDWSRVQAKGLAHVALNMFMSHGAELYRQRALAGLTGTFARKLISEEQSRIIDEILQPGQEGPKIDGRKKRSLHLQRIKALRAEIENNHILNLADLLPGEELEIGLVQSTGGLRTPTKTERKKASGYERVISLRIIEPGKGVVEIIRDSEFIEGYSTTAFRGKQICDLSTTHPITKKTGPFITRYERLHLNPHQGGNTLRNTSLIWWVSSKGEILF